MCLVVYLGTDAALPYGDPGGDGLVGLNPEQTRPEGLQDKANIYSIVDWHAGRPCCSCVFTETINPWEDVSEYDRADAEVDRMFRAYDRLRAICDAALAADPEAMLLCVWSGEEAEPPRDSREAVPGDFRPGSFAFADARHGDAHRLFRLRAPAGPTLP